MVTMYWIGNLIDLLDDTETVTYRTENSIDGSLQKIFQVQVEKRNHPL
jgi:hypothetical protein